MRPNDWRSGDRCWIIDLVAPRGGTDNMLKALQAGPLADKSFHLLRLDRETGKPVAQVLKGHAVGTDVVN